MIKYSKSIKLWMFTFLLLISSSYATLPVISSLSISTPSNTNLSTQNITGQWISTDADGDRIYNITDWRVNGNSIALLNVPFESVFNNRTRDYSTYNQSVKLINNVIFKPTGGYDGFGRIVFNGTGKDFINVSTLHKISGNNATFSIEIWIKPNSNGVIMKKSVPFDEQNGDFFLIIQPSFLTYKMAFALWTTGTGWYPSFIETSTSPSMLNNWHDVVITHDGNRNLTFYVDAKQVGIFTGVMYNEASVHNIQIGLNQTGLSTPPYNGSMDTVRIYNRTLSIQEIALLNSTKTNANRRIVSQETKLGEMWSLCVTPNDGISDGLTSCSNTITIIPPALPVTPTQSSLLTKLLLSILLILYILGTALVSYNIIVSGELGVGLITAFTSALILIVFIPVIASLLGI